MNGNPLTFSEGKGKETLFFVLMVVGKRLRDGRKTGKEENAIEVRGAGTLHWSSS